MCLWFSMYHWVGLLIVIRFLMTILECHYARLWYHWPMIPQTCIVTLQCTPQETDGDKETDPRYIENHKHMSVPPSHTYSSIISCFHTPHPIPLNLTCSRFHTLLFSLPPQETSTKVTYTNGSPRERDGNYNKPEFVQSQEETLMSIVLN